MKGGQECLERSKGGSANKLRDVESAKFEAAWDTEDEYTHKVLLRL